MRQLFQKASCRCSGRSSSSLAPGVGGRAPGIGGAEYDGIGGTLCDGTGLLEVLGLVGVFGRDSVFEWLDGSRLGSSVAACA